MKHILTIFFVNLLFTIAFSQSLDKTKNNAEPDTLNGIDSAATLERSLKSKSESTSYEFFMRFWDQKNISRMYHPLSFTYRIPGLSARWRELSSGSEIFRRYGNLNFQGGTAYRFNYAHELYKKYVLKPDYGNGMIVPILQWHF